MLDLVPFAGTRWKMTNAQLQLQSVCQTLQSYFPQSASTTVAAATVRRDHQFTGAGKALAAHVFVPTMDTVGCKLSGVVIDADAHPALIVGHIVNSIRNGLTQILVFKVMNANFLGVILGPPFLARILEISH